MASQDYGRSGAMSTSGDGAPTLTARFRFNWELRARADSVVYFLVEIAAMEPGRITARCFAESRPAAPNDSPANRSMKPARRDRDRDHRVVGARRGDDTEKRAQSTLCMAVAVSHMRLAKPHSLSYQLSTRTNVPSITCVCVASKFEDAGLWLKSTDTNSSVT